LMLHLFKQVSTFDADPTMEEEKLLFEDDVDSNSNS